MTITEKLRQFDTAEISDALDACGIEGALIGIKPLKSGIKLIGPIFTVRYSLYENNNNKTFKNAGNYIDDVPGGSVIFIDNNGRTDCTTWGDILTQVAEIKNILGTIVYGAVRDVDFISKCNYPVFSSGVYMRSGKNRVYKSSQQCQLNINNILVAPGDIAFADDNGVIVIPRSHLNEVVEKAENIKKTEKDILESVKSGLKLEEARNKYRYDQPWLNAENK